MQSFQLYSVSLHTVHNVFKGNTLLLNNMHIAGTYLNQMQFNYLNITEFTAVENYKNYNKD